MKIRLVLILALILILGGGPSLVQAQNCFQGIIINVCFGGGSTQQNSFSFPQTSSFSFDFSSFGFSQPGGNVPFSFFGGSSGQPSFSSFSGQNNGQSADYSQCEGLTPGGIPIEDGSCEMEVHAGLPIVLQENCEPRAVRQYPEGSGEYISCSTTGRYWRAAPGYQPPPTPTPTVP